MITLRIPLAALRPAAILLLGLICCRPASARDYTFFILSDTHLGAEQPKANPPVTREQVAQQVRANLDRVRQLPGQPFPLPGLERSPIAVPRGLFILGDLADGHKDPAKAQEQWAAFENIFPRAGVSFGEHSVPIHAIAGNHDGDPADPVRRGLIERNRALHAAGRLSAISDNGVHFAMNWEGVHLVCVNLCPADTTDPATPFRFGKPGPGSWNDPEMALSFLKDYLRKQVGPSGEPVIVMQHYGFDDFSIGDWYWWTPKQRRALYDLLADYNIAAIAHGHNHHAEHYTWPHPKRHAADLSAMFGDNVPAAPRQHTILSCGGVCWVIRIRGNDFIAAHLRGPDWSARPAGFIKSLVPVKAQ